MSKPRRQSDLESEKVRKKSDESEKRPKPPVDRQNLEQVRRNQLVPGTLIRSHNKNSFEVLYTLGFGGFGDVYAVKETHTEKQYALKTEENVKGKESRLKVEVLVFQRIDEISRIDPRKTSHFIHMFDRGMNESFKFVVMKYTGPNLEDIRTRYLGRDFSFSTALRLAIQTCEAVTDLHALGYVHRDVKPANFCVGRRPEERGIVYQIDFGISCKISDAKADARAFRFVGTVRYASRSCHEGKGQTPKDDLESWIYVAVEFFDRLGLPWRRCTNHIQVVRMKKDFFQHKHPECYAVCPAEMKQLVDHLEQAGGGQHIVPPDFFLGSLRELLVKKRIAMSDDYDWTEIDLLGLEDAARRKPRRTGSNERIAASPDGSCERVDQSRKKGKQRPSGEEDEENISASLKQRKNRLADASAKKKKASPGGNSGKSVKPSMRLASDRQDPSDKERKGSRERVGRRS